MERLEACFVHEFQKPDLLSETLYHKCLSAVSCIVYIMLGCQQARWGLSVSSCCFEVGQWVQKLQRWVQKLVCLFNFILPWINFFLIFSNMRSDREGHMKMHLWDWWYRMLPALRPYFLTNRHQASALDSRCISMWFVPWMHKAPLSSTVIAFWA